MGGKKRATNLMKLSQLRRAVLAASLERCKPEPLHLVEEPPQARVVTRDSEVVQMSFQHLFHPSTGFRDGVVHHPAQLNLDRQQLGSHPFLDRFAPDDEGAPFAGSRAEVRVSRPGNFTAGLSQNRA
jgi:hypothetical protein